MKFKLIFAFLFLFEVICISALKLDENRQKVTLKTAIFFLQKFLKTNESSCNEWEEGVQLCYEGCKNVLDNFKGITFEIGKTVIKSFKSLKDKAAIYTESNSTIISSKSIAILKTMSRLKQLGKSPSYLLNEFRKALPGMSLRYRRIIENCSDAIGEIIKPINRAISDCESSMIDLIKLFQNRLVDRNLNGTGIDIKPVLKSARLLTNTIALIADTALHNCDCCFTIHNDVYEVISITIWISFHFLLATEGTIANIGAVLDTEMEDMSDSIHLCLLSMDPLLDGISNAVTDMTLNVQKSSRDLSSRLVDLTRALNEATESQLGAFTGVEITVTQILKNLKRS